MEFRKANALELELRNMIKWLIKSLLRFQYLLYLLHLCKIYYLVLIGYNPHRQLKSSLGKNLSLYSLIGAWLVIALEAFAHRELKCSKYLSYELPLMYISLIMLLSLLTRLRKCFPFKFKAWKIIFHLLERLLHLFFLLKSQDNLQGNSRMELNNLVSLLTTLWRDQLYQLGHFQNSIEFFW